ncbi:MAG: methyltransferase, partial [Chitinophagaceae bacterium]|nr:methyltransferase [Chitinophagaceae bacterium]
MSNTCFKFKQFLINQDRCAMKVTTDACLFGAWVAERLRNAEGNCLDIGTGTGLLSLMLAQKAAGIFTVAVEIDADCAEQARENIEASPWKQQVVVKEADILQYTPANQYDFIISNPPFYQDDLKSPDTRKNVAHHDHGLQ